MTFTRRDLLRRHRRLVGHDQASAANRASLASEPGSLSEQISIRDAAADTGTVHDPSFFAQVSDPHPRAQPLVQHATPETSNRNSHDGGFSHEHGHLDLPTQLLDDSASNTFRTTDPSLHKLQILISTHACETSPDFWMVLACLSNGAPFKEIYTQLPLNQKKICNRAYRREPGLLSARGCLRPLRATVWPTWYTIKPVRDHLRHRLECAHNAHSAPCCT